jgi:L-fucose isomerase-like protein
MMPAVMKPVLVLALGRPTFDVPFAEEYTASAFAALDAAGLATTGPRGLLFDGPSARAAISGIHPEDVSALLLLQVTFTDASMTVELARAFPGLPLAIWSFAEPRAGGRLRLNSFCGLNLAAHALGRAGLAHRWFAGNADDPALPGFLAAIASPAPAIASRIRPARAGDSSAKSAAERIETRLMNRRIGLVGEHPAGFETCRYEPETLQSLAGVSVTPIGLGETFERARAVPEAETDQRREAIEPDYQGLDAVDQGQLRKSLALHAALEGLKADHALDAFAVRCWPETFTEYGCAVCGPMGMLTEAGTPCACEADMFGALTALLMQEAAGAPAWLVDIVDLDPAADTGVIWHCGSAPLSMRDPKAPAEAQIHSNRKMPLLAQFPLKPGPITLARISQARNRVVLVLGSGEVRRAPPSFTGTSGVVALEGGIAAARSALLDEALEHHVAITYGDQRAILEAWAARKGLPVLDLTA